MAQAGQRVNGQRLAVWAVLAVVGILSLPLSATLLDGQGTENWILPAAVVATALVGALVGAAMPGFAGPDASRARGAVRGALTGVVMCVLGVVIFFLLLSGFGGA